MTPIPVILDTDLGTDIDDSWALAMLLKSPELDLKLVTAATGDTRYRAAIAARLLECACRDDVILAPGRDNGDYLYERTLLPWVEGYDVTAYPNFKPAAAEAMVELVMRSPQPVTLVAIAPLTNVGDALRLEPAIAPKVNFVGMHGSLFKSHDDQPGAFPEWNVLRDVEAARRVFAAPWRSATITPLDSCGGIRLDGAFTARMKASRDPLCRAVYENWLDWLAFYRRHTPGALPDQPERTTSVLFDTVAIFLAFSRQWLDCRKMRLVVTDDGFTREDAAGHPVDVALNWTDRPAYLEFLKARLAP